MDEKNKLESSDELIEKIKSGDKTPGLIDKYVHQEIIEYVTEGANDKNAAVSKSVILLQHLIKFKYEQNLQTRSWINTIYRENNELGKLVSNNSNIKNEVISNLDDSYKKGKSKVLDEYKSKHSKQELKALDKEIPDDNEFSLKIY